MSNNSRTPTYDESLYIPFDTPYIVHLYVKVGNHTEAIEYELRSLEGEVDIDL